MQRKIYIRSFICLLLAGVFALFTSFNLATDEAKFYALGNRTPDNLTFAELHSILRGEKQRWKDGTKITLALMKSSTPIGSMVTKKIFFMTDKELNKYFLSLVFQGKISAPVFFDSEAELSDYIAKNEGAIGVVGTEIKGKGKIILIDGKANF